MKTWEAGTVAFCITVIIMLLVPQATPAWKKIMIGFLVWVAVGVLPRRE